MASSRTRAKRPAQAKAASAANGVVNRKRPSPDKTVKQASLDDVLNQTEAVQAKVERWADELSSINEVLVDEASALSASPALERAIDRNEDLEGDIQASADTVSGIGAGLTMGIAEGKKLKRKLLSSNTRKKENRRLALHDPLTGLPNRMLFNDRLKQVLAQAKRHDRGVAIMFIDLDDFKLVNDSYGHDVGDTVLRHVAQRLQGSMRAEDTVSRHGGDEFLCIMVEANDERNIATVAAKMINVIAVPTDVGESKLTVKPSIGIAVYPKDGETATVLVKKADAAMYLAKRSRKGYVFFNPGCSAKRPTRPR